MNRTAAQVRQLKNMLEGLDGWIEKAVQHAQAKSFDPDVLLAARLAPDQYPLVRQIQAACDAAKFAAARVAGKEAPKHPDTEQTIDQIRTRVRAVVSYLAAFDAKELEGAETREIALPFLENKKLRGADYLDEIALPNFYFHLTHAYALLRHNGVELGKRDFVRPTSMY